MTDFAALKIYSFVIISQSLPSCQVLFLTFLDLFCTFFRVPAFATLLYYHICWRLSSGFWKFFKSFFKKVEVKRAYSKMYRKERFCTQKIARNLFLSNLRTRPHSASTLVMGSQMHTHRQIREGVLQGRIQNDSICKNNQNEFLMNLTNCFFSVILK